MIYKLAPHVTEEMLVGMGFRIEQIGLERTAWKTVDDEELFVVLDYITTDCVYGQIDLNHNFITDKNKDQFIGDLIEKGMVIVE